MPSQLAPAGALDKPFVLGVLPLLVVPFLFVIALPRLRTVGSAKVSLVGVATAIFVMAYANYLAYRYQRGLDEAQNAGNRFAAQWGMSAGQAAFVLLTMLPPVKDFALSLVSGFAHVPAASVDRTLVFTAILAGFCGVVVLQAIGTFVVNMIWWRSMR